MSKTLELTFIYCSSFSHFLWMSQFPKVAWQFDLVHMIWFSCFFWKADINQRRKLRPKGSMLLIAVLTNQRAERLLSLELCVEEIWMAGNLTWEMYFSLWMQLKYETVGTKPVPQYSHFVSNAHAFHRCPPKYPFLQLCLNIFCF